MSEFDPKWTDAEKAAIKELATSHGISPGAVLRQAVRLYQLHHKRLSDGETCTYSGDVQRIRQFCGYGGA